MSLPQLKPMHYTIEDWKSWEGRWELINGVAYNMTPATNTKHQSLSSKLHAALFNALADARRKAGGGGYQLFHAPTDVFLH